MAIEETDRLGLPTYTSGTDAHPIREDFNARMQLLDQLAAIVEEGPHEDRGLPQTWGRFWLSTDTRDLYFDRGNEWVLVARIGGGGAGQDVTVSSSPSEGSSDRAARADHTHRLPLATSSAHGAMSSADKSLIDQASNVSYPNRLVRRDSSGRINVPDPSLTPHATNKAYVDDQVATRAASSHTHSASDVSSGVLHHNRIPAATSSTQGAISATHFSMLNDAHWDGGDGTLVRRSSPNRRIRIGDPGSADDATTKRYVDQQIGDHSHSGTDITSGTVPAARLPAATQSTQGAMSAADKEKLDLARADAIGGRLVLRLSGGQASFADPVANLHAANKQYVDAATSTGSVVNFRGNLTSSTHLDTVTGQGEYTTTGTSTVHPDNGYPIDGEAGVLSVRSSGLSYVQEWTQTNGTPRRWIRTRNTSGTWFSWRELT
ncbi:pyocin knob domain-containing protein [Nesterenkonia sp. HG001]|uniref:pyocin knob domain-containing protein n=1 Tax=Nesterenkonia sp. HG001 TaxID=2983207 RepID=UPI002AC58456|nr:pyocin knob domain-containing protein [Nesterenkonia sp. HG001]MDZ5076723.1 pyocin knob domain-containing protein [Nesterenkonia sp. HG001]